MVIERVDCGYVDLALVTLAAFPHKLKVHSSTFLTAWSLLPKLTPVMSISAEDFALAIHSLCETWDAVPDLGGPDWKEVTIVEPVRTSSLQSDFEIH